jgi:hypothetical protein
VHFVALLLSAAVLSGAELNETRTLRETFTVGSGGAPQWLIVDGHEGSIHVVGTKGGAVEMTATETITAPSSSELTKAREEVRLDVSQQGDTIRLYVDGPFRCQERARTRGTCGDRDHRRYRVRYDFELRVPLGTSLELRTVDGEIRGEGTRGELAIRNVNGGILLTEVDGYGDVRTVNGRVEVRFARNPERPLAFATVNGDIDIGVRTGFGADVRSKSLNGDLYTDFPYELQALPAEATRAKEGRLVIRSSGSAVRLGSGGPRLDLETVNGDLLIRNLDR